VTGTGHWVTLADEPGLADQLRAVESSGPAFLAELTARHREQLSRSHPGEQWLYVAAGRVEAVVRGLALPWDGTSGGAPEAGVGGAMVLADTADTADTADDVDTLAVLDLTVIPDRRGRGLGRHLLGDLDALRERGGRQRLLLLVRPHAKDRHPLVPFARYVTATDEAGRPRDGWLAAAWESGFHPVLGVDRSLVARAPVAVWERWYGSAFPTSGPYLLPGAIKPAIVEYEIDEGRYREPHLWMAPRKHLAQRTVDPAALRVPQDAWRRALAAAGLVAGSRRHRQVRRELD
jgi:ribosomal protein S18 acetylase RimI-like enzyme